MLFLADQHEGVFLEAQKSLVFGGCKRFCHGGLALDVLFEVTIGDSLVAKQVLVGSSLAAVESRLVVIHPLDHVE